MITKIILFILSWFMFNFIVVTILRILLNYKGKVRPIKFNPFLESLILLETQIKYLKSIVNWFLNKLTKDKMADRKTIILNNVVNHLNQTLSHDLNLKMVSPATTKGVDVWIYLTNKLNDSEKINLENYFSGVLSKYTNEFSLDILIVEQFAGAGWVAKFDIKPIAEANYNRMARTSEVAVEDVFDEDIDIW